MVTNHTDVYSYFYSETLNEDTFGTLLKRPDYQGVFFQVVELVGARDSALISGSPHLVGAPLYVQCWSRARIYICTVDVV